MIGSKIESDTNKMTAHKEIELIIKSLDSDVILLPKDIVSRVETALIAAKKLQDTNLQYLLNIRFSRYFLRKQDYVNAKKYAEIALELAISIGSIERIAHSRIRLATICYNKKELNDALSLLKKALNEHVPHQKFDIYMSIAGVFIMMQKYNVALEYYEKAKKIVNNSNHLNYIGLHLNTSLALCSLERYDEANENINAALQLLKEDSKYKYPKAICFANLADVNFAQKKYAKSIDCLHKAIELYDELHMPEAKLNALLTLAKSHMALEEDIPAYQILQKALQTFSKDDYLQLYLEGLKTIVSLAKKLNKLEDCVEYQNQLIEVQSEYFYPEKKEKIEALLNKKEGEIDVLLSKNQEIEKQNQQLQQYNKELEQYAFIIAHDLKEPLCNISGFTSLLKNQDQQQLNPEVTSFLQYIESGTQHMHQLLEDLLHYSTLRIDTTKFEAVQLPKIIEEIVEEYKQALTLQHTHISITDTLPTIYAESKHIKSLITQLIGNALKFQAPNRDGQIEIRSFEKNNKTFIEIKDNGIGIKKVHQQKVFRIFQRLNKDDYNGTGIGLATCKKIVELYEGEIELQSEIGVGTRVCFSLGRVS